ncbi:MAG: D-alanyl-D-alanine carboxypeptidase [Ktedonobacteraceae bacterium]|nr:D-alanyl-D-alanine carboxypeptidase [Ktedonobacteraceae bacterium]
MNVLFHRPSQRVVLVVTLLTVCSLFLLNQNGTAHAARRVLPPAPPKIAATYAYLIDPETEQVFFSKDAQEEVEMASTTKIMTALLVLEDGELNRLLVVKQAYIDYVLDNNASNAGLLVGDRLTVKDLLYALLLPSGADAGQALADQLFDGVPHFVKAMNQEAQALGLKHTYFVTPDGLHLPDAQGKFTHSTATEMARLSEVAMQEPLFRQIVDTVTFSVATTPQHHAYIWTNTNKLLVTYRGAIGIKTGTTDQAGPCVIAEARRNGHILIAVIFHSSSVDQRFVDAAVLLDFGFQVEAEEVSPAA